MTSENSPKNEGPKPIKPGTTEYSKKSYEPGNVVNTKKPATSETVVKWQTQIDIIKEKK